ncbi:hypothetical protein HYPSUDRAFT_148772 [Hypholoma sublateritium FD-334 SS-4]|uniref:DUF659 domain-containing protein n=1 Tax=Hypholoma sublateritium (strain FD-334 SS-4) TaxID=945553 RepID=A0A0D2LXP2_HYPSF|nr:hypothetical protein HYPSUDRAFT_148772 [Hypholoma sublateritium FD-334 SS-4]
MAVRQGTSESHTAVWIKTFVLTIINKVGRARLCATVCDSTGNTRLFRELLAAEIPTIFNLPDIVHFISNTIKDIVRLPVFKPTITVLRGVITKFHKSHLGEAELAVAHTATGITKGLDAIGKTRFGTIIIASWALQVNIPSIKIVVDRDNFDLGEFSQYFRMTSTSFQFELALARLIKVGLPALKSLTCLEANEADPGDVYVFWHAMIWAIHEELKDPLNEFPQDVQDQVIGILNSRHEQLLGSGNLSTAANVYLSGAYLNPSKVACLLSHRFTNKKSL